MATQSSAEAPLTTRTSEQRGFGFVQAPRGAPKVLPFWARVGHRMVMSEEARLLLCLMTEIPLRSALLMMVWGAVCGSGLGTARPGHNNNEYRAAPPTMHLAPLFLFLVRGIHSQLEFRGT